MGTVPYSVSADGSNELFYLPARTSSTSYEKLYAPWMAQYFEPLQKVQNREWCYSRAKENHRMQQMDLCLGVFVIY